MPHARALALRSDAVRSRFNWLFLEQPDTAPTSHFLATTRHLLRPLPGRSRQVGRQVVTLPSSQTSSSASVAEFDRSPAPACPAASRPGNPSTRSTRPVGEQLGGGLAQVGSNGVELRPGRRGGPGARHRRQFQACQASLASSFGSGPTSSQPRSHSLTTLTHLWPSAAETQAKWSRRGSSAEEVHQRAEDREAPPGHQVALHVVAVARVAARDQHAVGAVLEGLEDEQRVHPAGAGKRTRRTWPGRSRRVVPAMSAPA